LKRSGLQIDQLDTAMQQQAFESASRQSEAIGQSRDPSFSH
jgi:hypothetical protein